MTPGPCMQVRYNYQKPDSKFGVSDPKNLGRPFGKGWISTAAGQNCGNMHASKFCHKNTCTLGPVVGWTGWVGHFFPAYRDLNPA